MKSQKACGDILYVMCTTVHTARHSNKINALLVSKNPMNLHSPVSLVIKDFYAKTGD
jgi:hypothetical protein